MPGNFLNQRPSGTSGQAIEPFSQQAKLVGGNISIPNPVQQMFQQKRRKIFAANARYDYSP
jgi:hypothetical protein